MLTAEEHIARDILAVRNRVTHWKEGIEDVLWKISCHREFIGWQTSAWSSIESDGKRRISQINRLWGSSFLSLLPKIQGMPDFSHKSSMVAESVSLALLVRYLRARTGSQMDRSTDQLERKELLYKLTFQAFKTLRITPTPKISLYPALIYMALLLIVDNRIGANLEELQTDLDMFSKDPDTQYEVRFSHRENEAYLIFPPT